MLRTLRTLATWLLLVAYLASGVLPARGVVVCFEADGSAALELVARGCEDCSVTETALPSDTEHAELTSCPCVDVPLPLACAESQTKPRQGAPSTSHAALLPAPPIIVSFDVLDCARAASISAPSEPRPAPRLALIRTIVLRV